MSGGHFNCDYRYGDLMDIAYQVDKDGDPLFADFLKDVYKLIHDYDWYKSDDTCKENWHKSRKAFVEKWKETPFIELAESSIKERVEKMYKEALTPEYVERFDAEW